MSNIVTVIKMDNLRVADYLVKSGWNRERAKKYADVLVGVFWGLLKTAY